MPIHDRNQQERGKTDEHFDVHRDKIDDDGRLAASTSFRSAMGPVHESVVDLNEPAYDPWSKPSGLCESQR